VNHSELDDLDGSDGTHYMGAPSMQQYSANSFGDYTYAPAAAGAGLAAGAAYAASDPRRQSYGSMTSMGAYGGGVRSSSQYGGQSEGYTAQSSSENYAPDFYPSNGSGGGHGGAAPPNEWQEYVEGFGAAGAAGGAVAGASSHGHEPGSEYSQEDPVPVDSRLDPKCVRSDGLSLPSLIASSRAMLTHMHNNNQSMTSLNDRNECVRFHTGVHGRSLDAQLLPSAAYAYRSPVSKALLTSRIGVANPS
jgi:hypothetical protein